MTSLHYCTIDDIKSLIPATSRYDTTLTVARDAATEVLNTYMRRNFEYGVRTQFYKSRDTKNGDWQKIWTDDVPIDTHETVSLWYSPIRQFDDDSLLTVDTDYLVDHKAGKITIMVPMGQYPNSIKVSYTAGYKEILVNTPAPDTPTGILDVPSSLRHAATQQAAFMAERMIEREDGQENKKTGIAVLRAEAAARAMVLPEVRLVLNTYRRQLGAVIS